MLATPDADALRSVSLVDDTPYKMWRIEQDRLVPLLSLDGIREPHSMPRQSLPPVYVQNGYVDVIRPRTILEMGSMCGRNVLALVIEGEVPDLDRPSQIPAVEAAVTADRERRERENRATRAGGE
jgi:N-acylneuraminate cytidylyltransferase